MVRELTSHKVAGLNEALKIEVLDEPGPGNACHLYRISGQEDNRTFQVIWFQCGLIEEDGVSGVSNEALLAIVADRLDGFQAGDYACLENARAMDLVNEAMLWLAQRTRDRLARGVEGKSEA